MNAQAAKFVRFYVPSTKDTGTVLSAYEAKELTQRIAEAFVFAFDGCTATQGTGYYKANDGSIIAENVTLVTSFVYDIAGALGIVIPLAEAIKAEYAQESILVETSTDTYFI